MQDWASRDRELRRLAEGRLFFVGGAPRSGTTWLQQIFNSHPDACCRGEGLFLKELIAPIERAMSARAEAVRAKNAIFPHTPGYPLPDAAEVEHLSATAILLALHRQTEGRRFEAVGEKTPENVFLFWRLAKLFPTARFVAIARDPRDVLSSAWHFFQPGQPQTDDVLEAFLKSALPSLNEGARCMFGFAREHPERYCEVTYEALLAHPAAQVARLFAFLGLSHDEDIVARCVDATSLSSMTKGMQVGQGSFFRAPNSDWRTTLSPRLGALVLQELGWMFDHFGWSK